MALKQMLHQTFVTTLAAAMQTAYPPFNISKMNDKNFVYSLLT